MKHLRVENGKVHFSTNGIEWADIDQINKDSLLTLINLSLTTEFEMDEYSDQTIRNPAHQIIYRNLYTRFTELLGNKTRFKDESMQMFREAIEKYSQTLE